MISTIVLTIILYCLNMMLLRFILIYIRAAGRQGAALRRALQGSGPASHQPEGATIINYYYTIIIIIIIMKNITY